MITAEDILLLTSSGEGYNSEVSLSLNGTVEKTVENIIKNLILENPKITTKNMIKATGLTRKGVEYQLNKLKDSGKIERVGPDRGGYWRVIEINIEH